jgi:hypothetical protein
VYCYNGEWKGERHLNDRPVAGISPQLQEEAVEVQLAERHRLYANRVSCSDGVKVQGIGFVIGEQERAALCAEDPRNAEVLSRYIVGDDLNSAPDQMGTRWVVNFWTRTEEQAKRFSGPWRILSERVKPYRDSLTRQVHEDCFWKFWDRREAFFDSVRQRPRVLVSSKLSKHFAVSFADPQHIYSEKVKVFDFVSWSAFALLQSSIHSLWAYEWGSYTGSSFAYTGSGCFDTFPFPPAMCPPSGETRLAPTATDPKLERPGEVCHSSREVAMKAGTLSLTAVYNRFHDPGTTEADVLRMREDHIAVDEAVVAAYGWYDLDLDHGFYPIKPGERFTIHPEARAEILARLLALNHQRYAEEVAAGLHAPTSGKAKPAKAKKRPKPAAEGAGLFKEAE